MCQKKIRWAVVVVLLLSICQATLAQDSVTAQYGRLQQRYASDVNGKVSAFNSRVESYTEKSLGTMIAQEKSMQSKVARIDSLKAKKLFAYSIDSLTRFQSLIKCKTSKLTRIFGKSYFPYLDTLKGSLSFLKKADSATTRLGAEQSKLNAEQSKLSASMGSVDKMQAKLATIDQINEYLKQRQAVLQNELGQVPGLSGPIQHFGNQINSYQAQVTSYKQTLSDPDKIEKVMLQQLENTPAFQQFFQQHSQLNGIFQPTPNLSSLAGGLGSMPVVNGIPSRGALQQFVKQQMPDTTVDPVQVVQQKVQDNNGNQGSGGGGSIPSLSSLSSLTSLTGKLPTSGQYGGASGMPQVPANTQSGKSFGKRLEYGLNVQFGSTTNYLPATCNLGAQIGYKLSDKTSFGIGISYAMGLGTGWNDIRLSNNSVGVRSYLKWKPSKAFFLQGGAEWNYMTSFNGIDQLKDLNAWQTSALIGIGREYKVSKKVSGSVLLLYDFLYDTHVPVSQPFSFRVGYNF